MSYTLRFCLRQSMRDLCVLPMSSEHRKCVYFCGGGGERSPAHCDRRGATVVRSIEFRTCSILKTAIYCLVTWCMMKPSNVLTMLTCVRCNSRVGNRVAVWHNLRFHLETFATWLISEIAMKVNELLKPRGRWNVNYMLMSELMLCIVIFVWQTIGFRNFVIFVCCAHRIFCYDFVVVCRSLIMKSIE